MSFAKKTSKEVTSAEDPTSVSLNLSALAEENIGSAIAELETTEAAFVRQSPPQVDPALSSEGGRRDQQVPVVLPPASESSMQDYHQLQQNLLKLTLVFTVVIFFVVWGTYSLATALNYIVGAVTGIVYFRMLARSVGKIGRDKSKPSSSRFAVFVGVMVVSTQWQQLSVLPVFLGFLTYKAALIAYVIWTAALPQQEAA